MEKLISVKALSEELGVSKPTLFKRIDKLNLRSELIKQGKALMIPEEVANTLREAYTVSEAPSDKAEKLSENEDITASLIELLRAELNSKNQLIESLQKQVERLQEDNRQAMQLIGNSQALLAGSLAKDSKAEAVEAEFTEEPEEVQSEPEAREEELNAREIHEKKGFFRRLFGL